MRRHSVTETPPPLTVESRNFVEVVKAWFSHIVATNASLCLRLCPNEYFKAFSTVSTAKVSNERFLFSKASAMMIENCFLRRRPKERFSTGTHNVGFIFWAMSCRSYNSQCCLSWVTLHFQQALGSPFSPNSSSF